MLLAEVDWKELIGLASLITTTMGGILIAYIALKQRQTDTKVELARLDAVKAAEAAKLEAIKQGKRSRRKVKELTDKTDEQTAIISDIRKQTNGMQDQIVKQAHEEGKRQGAETEKARITEVAAEVAKVVAKEIVPTPVLIANPEPIQVHDSGETSH